MTGLIGPEEGGKQRLAGLGTSDRRKKLSRNQSAKGQLLARPVEFRLLEASPRFILPSVPPEENPWPEVPRLARELLAHAIKVVLEACFLITWAFVIWGISEVLARIEPHMPDWAKLMFKYVEIGFALFLLSEMFLVRATVFERAVMRAGQLLRRTRQSLTSATRPPTED